MGLDAALRAHRRVQLAITAAAAVAATTTTIAAAATTTATATTTRVSAAAAASGPEPRFGFTPTTRAPRALLALALIPATLAAIRSMGQPMLLVERLFSRREEELLATVHALEALIFAGIHVRMSPRFLVGGFDRKQKASTARAAEAIQATIPARKTDC